MRWCATRRRCRARPYKPSWTNAEAYAWLRKLARVKFDADCVDALAYNAQKVAEIQTRFRDTEAPAPGLGDALAPSGPAWRPAADSSVR